MKISEMKLYHDCLIVVDMVNGFVWEGALHDSNISRIVPRQLEIIENALSDGKIVVFIKDTHTKDSVEFVRFGGGMHCLEETSECELISSFLKYEKSLNTISITKNSTSFMEAPMFREFMEYQTELENFEIIGCCTDICVVNGVLGLANYLDQQNRSHHIVVHEDAIATYQEEEREDYVVASKLLMKQQGVELRRK